MNNKNEIITPGIADEDFIRGSVPMTKEEVRILTVCKLRLTEGKNIIYDIGAGTGSISIEIAHLNSINKVYSFEKNTEAVELLAKNINKFNIENIEIKAGDAPATFAGLPVADCWVIGGSGGRLRDLFASASKYLKNHGVLVANFITLENLHHTMEYLKEYNFENIEVSQVQVNRGETIGGMFFLKPLNPIFIVKAVRRSN